MSRRPSEPHKPTPSPGSRLDHVLRTGFEVGAGLGATAPCGTAPFYDVDEIGMFGDNPGDRAKPWPKAPSYSFGPLRTSRRARIAPAPEERRRANPNASDLEVVRESIAIQTEIIERIDREVQTLEVVTARQNDVEDDANKVENLIIQTNQSTLTDSDEPEWLKEAEVKLKTLTTTIDDMDAQIAELTNTIQDLVEQLKEEKRASNASIAALKEEVNTYKGLDAESKAMKDQLKKAIEDCESELDGLRHKTVELDECRKLSIAQRRRIEELERQKQSALERLFVSQNNAVRYRRQLEDMERDMEQMQRDNPQYRNQIAVQERRIQELQREKQTALERAMEGQASAKRYADQIRELEEEKDRMRNATDPQSMERIKLLEKRIGELEREKRDALERSVIAQTRAKQYNDKIAEMKDELENRLDNNDMDEPQTPGRERAYAEALEGMETLYEAAKEGDLKLVQKLLRRGVNPDDTTGSKYGSTALILASKKGHAAIVRALLDAGADVNHVNSKGNTALMRASRNGHVTIVEMLLAARANVNTVNNNGQTALMPASAKGHADVVAALLAANPPADANMANKIGVTALMIASDEGHADVVSALLAKGAKVNMAANDGYTALMYASYEGHIAIVAALLAADANVNQKDTFGVTALEIASAKGHTEIVEMLRATGVRSSTYPPPILNQNSSRGFSMDDLDEPQTPGRERAYAGALEGMDGVLFGAARDGDLGLVQKLLQRGVNPDDTTGSKYGNTPLMAASEKGHVAIVRALLDAGANVKHATNDGWTALYLASSSDNVAIVEMLLAAGASINKATDVGRTALMAASASGRTAIVVALLAVPGIAVNQANNEGRTALMYTSALSHGRTAIVELLLAAGADINQTNWLGWTALNEAAYSRNTAVVEMLTALGAQSVQIEDSSSSEEEDNTPSSSSSLQALRWAHNHYGPTPPPRGGWAVRTRRRHRRR